MGISELHSAIDDGVNNASSEFGMLKELANAIDLAITNSNELLALIEGDNRKTLIRGYLNTAMALTSVQRRICDAGEGFLARIEAAEIELRRA
jgi:hypothetical protein